MARESRRRILLLALSSIITVLLGILVNIATGSSEPRLLAEHLLVSWLLLGLLVIASTVIAVRSTAKSNEVARVHTLLTPDVRDAIREVESHSFALYANAADPTASDLPPAPSPFIGRKRERDLVLSRFRGGWEGNRRTPALVIYGKPGVGKSSLAIKLAHGLLDSTAEARGIYIDMEGFSRHPRTPESALDELLSRLGANPDTFSSRATARAAQYRGIISQVPTVLLLDNVTPKQSIDMLLPGRNCATLVTGRSPLPSFTGANSVQVGLLPLGEAIDLLRVTAGTRAHDLPPAELQELCDLGGYLPLALTVIGAILQRRPDMTPADLARALRDERSRLAKLRISEDLDVRTAIAISYQSLEKDSRSLFRRWGLLGLPTMPGSVLVALQGGDEQTNRASATVGALIDAQLVDALGEDRYGMHDLIRLFAIEASVDEEEELARAALTRALIAYSDEANAARKSFDAERNLLFRVDERPAVQSAVDRAVATAVSAGTDLLISGGPADRSAAILARQQAALSWLLREQDNLVKLVHLGAAHELWLHIPPLVLSLDMTLEFVGSHRARLPLTSIAWTTAKKLGDASLGAKVTLAQGNVHRHLGDAAAAISRLEVARRLYHSRGDVIGQGFALAQQGHVLRESGDHDTARSRYVAAAKLFESQQAWLGLAEVTSNLSIVLKLEGQLEEAERLAREGVRLYRQAGDLSFPSLKEFGWAVGNLGAVLGRLGISARAAEAHRASLMAFGLTNNRVGQGHALRNLGELARVCGRLDEGEVLLEASLVAFEESSDAHGQMKAHASLARITVRRGNILKAGKHARLSLRERRRLVAASRSLSARIPAPTQTESLHGDQQESLSSRRV